MGIYIDAFMSEAEGILKSEDGHYRESLEKDVSWKDCVESLPKWSDMVCKELKLEPEKRQDYEKTLEMIDYDVRKLVVMRAMVNTMIEEARERVAEIAMHFSEEYDIEKVKKAAHWFFLNVSKVKDLDKEFLEESCAEDGLAYIDECLHKALGEQQLFKVVDVRYQAYNEGVVVSFTIPECLGVWRLNMPFATIYKPSVQDYFGKYNEKCPFPLQMSISYSSPRSDDFIQTIMSAWSFHDMSKKWFMFNMEEHRKKQYLPYKIDDDGYVWKKIYNSTLGYYESRTAFTEREWMDLMREWHNKMLPDWAK
jgi:hypothetical protein